jgi:hypothetical protein
MESSLQALFVSRLPVLVHAASAEVNVKKFQSVYAMRLAVNLCRVQLVTPTRVEVLVASVQADAPIFCWRIVLLLTEQISETVFSVIRLPVLKVRAAFPLTTVLRVATTMDVSRLQMEDVTS